MKLIESKTVSESNERRALVACLINLEVYFNIINELTIDHFHQRTSKVIYDVYKQVTSKGDELDRSNIEPLLTNDLKALKTYNELLEINIIEDEIPSIIGILKDKKVRRDLAEFKSKVIKENDSNESAFVILDRINEILLKLNSNQNSSIVSVNDIIKENFDLPHLKEIEGLTGIPTGIDQLDKMTSGLQLGRVSVISGASSDGKSSLAMQIAKHAASSGFPTAIFSLEDSKKQYINRMLSNELQMDSYKVIHRQFDDLERQRAVRTLKVINKYNLYIDDSVFHTGTSIFNEIRKLNFRNAEPIKLIVVDFLQCISEETEYLQKLCRELQNSAKILDAHIMEISQWSRGREFKQLDWQDAPSLGDNKGSSSIEQFAHTVVSITSPSMRELGKNAINMKSKPAIIWHLKGKDAMTGPIPSVFHKYCYRFEELNEEHNDIEEFFNNGN